MSFILVTCVPLSLYCHCVIVRTQVVVLDVSAAAPDRRTNLARESVARQQRPDFCTTPTRDANSATATPRQTLLAPARPLSFSPSLPSPLCRLQCRRDDLICVVEPRQANLLSVCKHRLSVCLSVCLSAESTTSQSSPSVPPRAISSLYILTVYLLTYLPLRYKLLIPNGMFSRKPVRSVVSRCHETSKFSQTPHILINYLRFVRYLIFFNIHV